MDWSPAWAVRDGRPSSSGWCNRSRNCCARGIAFWIPRRPLSYVDDINNTLTPLAFGFFVSVLFQSQLIYWNCCDTERWLSSSCITNIRQCVMLQLIGKHNKFSTGQNI